MNRFLLTLGVCLAAGFSSQARAMIVGAGPVSLYADEQSAEDHAYEEGTKAMNEGRWSEAETSFRRTADLHGKRADGAIYWQAYAQNKQGHQKRAVRTCGTLASDYPQSRWRSECEALLVEARGAPNGSSVDSEDASRNPDDDLKLLALNSLMQQEPARALPILQSILQSNTQPARLKEKALFVLTQSQSKEAHDTLNQIARGKMDPDLQVNAIHMMAAMQGKESAAFLKEIYKNSQNERVRDAALDGMFISGDATDLIAIAKAENNPQLKRRVISKLSMMQGKEVTDYMLEILNK